MIGLGTLANAGAIVVGGICGLLFGKAIKDRMQKTLVAGMALGTMFIGAGTMFAKMLATGGDGGFRTHGELMLVLSLAGGAILGEWLDLDRRFEAFGVWLRRVSRNERDGSFVDAFVTASLTFCIGAMAIVGSIADGVQGDPSILYLKAVMDGIFTIVLTASLGKGACFSAIPILLYQGGITLGARFLKPYLTAAAMDNLSLVGGVLIFCVGWNILWNEKKIRTANLLPALVIAVAWGIFRPGP